MRTDGFLYQNWKINFNKTEPNKYWDNWMKYDALSYSGSVQDVILCSAFKRYKTIKHILFHYHPFPLLPLLPHLSLLQWIHKASEKSGEWCAYPLGSELLYSYCSLEQQLRTVGNQVLVFLLALH